jgi:hypothetical protein
MMKRSILVVGLISLTLIPLELTWTRILSAEFFYTFAFLVLSLAILGLGLGGLALRLFERLSQPRLMGGYLTGAAVCATAGPVIVFAIAPDFSQVFASWVAIAKLVAVVFILMSAYFFGGMALTMLFKYNHQDMPRLYMADLVAAGAGVLLAIWAMNGLGTPQASFLVALPILLAAVLTSRGTWKTVPIAVAVIVIAVSSQASSWLTLKREEPAPVIFTHWDAMSKIKVYQFSPDSRGINIDNAANTPVNLFDGNWADTSLAHSDWGIDVSYLVHQFDSCVFLSLGAGGGSDVLQALAEGATEVHAVEINGYINRMMQVADTQGYVRPAPSAPDTADSVHAADSSKSAAQDSVEAKKPLVSVAEFAGFLYRDPRVRVVTDDARAYVRRFKNKFDVIFSLSSNTFAALASGSFALAENYLFTTEAFEDYWHALSDSGFMMMEHQMYVPRLVTEVQDALTACGVANPKEHFAVYDLPKMRRKILFISKRSLTDELRYQAFLPLTPERFDQIHLIYPPANDSVSHHLIARIVNEGWRQVSDTAPINISPVTDNRPYVAQLGLWKNFTAERRGRFTAFSEFGGFPLSKMIMLVILAVAVVIAVPINLVPYFRKGPHLRPAAWLYFFCIGVAFMAVEVVLIQKYALLIGSSLYSVATVLLTLLISSGIGSRFARQMDDRLVFLFIAGWLVLDAVVFHHIITAAGALSLAPRMLVAAGLIAPLGFFMGMPFPKGTLRVGELIDWGFAVNGTASVIGSVVVLMVAFVWGFTVALILAAAFYLIAFALLRASAAWSPKPISPSSGQS